MPAKGRKYTQALDGARVVFMRDGFEGANVDDIARVAGISKATLYKYFPDKVHMFVAVLAQECQRQGDLIDTFSAENAPLRTVLLAQCRQLIAFLLDDWTLEMFRTVMAETRRFPELGQQFFEAGPARMQSAMAHFLASDPVRAELDIDDFDLAAEHLKMLCHADIFLKRLFAMIGPPSEADIDRVASAAVDTFLARYGRPGLQAAAE